MRTLFARVNDAPGHARSTVRGGWSRTRLPVTPEMVVLDIGSGTFPNPRADLLCERDLVDNRHRGGLAVVVDRPLVLGDALSIPLRDHAVDFVIASHIAEHIDEPVRFCHELARVARSGYIETPSPLFERLFDVEYHSWIVSRRGGELVFEHKRPRPAWMVRLTRPLYQLVFADQPSPNRPDAGQTGATAAPLRYSAAGRAPLRSRW